MPKRPLCFLLDVFFNPAFAIFLPLLFVAFIGDLLSFNPKRKAVPAIPFGIRRDGYGLLYGLALGDQVQGLEQMLVLV
jgi:hypothetical protein